MRSILSLVWQSLPLTDRRAPQQLSGRALCLQTTNFPPHSRKKASKQCFWKRDGNFSWCSGLLHCRFPRVTSRCQSHPVLVCVNCRVSGHQYVSNQNCGRVNVESVREPNATLFQSRWLGALSGPISQIHFLTEKFMCAVKFGLFCYVCSALFHLFFLEEQEESKEPPATRHRLLLDFPQSIVHLKFIFTCGSNTIPIKRQLNSLARFQSSDPQNCWTITACLQ